MRGRPDNHLIPSNVRDLACSYFLLLTSHFSLVQSGIPPDRPSVGLYKMPGMAAHAPVARLEGAERNQLAVSGAAAGADPFGRGGWGAHRSVPAREAASC